MEGIWQFVGEGLPEIALQVSADGTFLHIDRAPRTVLAGAVRGTSVYDHLPPAARPQVRHALREVFARREPYVVDLPLTIPDGGVRWYAARIAPVLYGESVVAANVVARDATLQKKAELALYESEARYRTLVEHAPEAIVIFDADLGHFIEANANACRMFGLTRDQLLARGPAQVSPSLQPDGRSSEVAGAEYTASALRGEAPCFEWVHVDSDGVHIQCEVRLVRLPAQDRRLVRRSIIDMTVQRRLERQIEQFQKLDALGHVAGGIAHDFNNVLTVINGSAELLLMTLPEESEERNEVVEIRNAAWRGMQLTRQILAFARSRESARELIDLNATVEQVTTMLRRLVGKDIDIDLRLSESSAPIVADRCQIDQIVTNLLLNARDAMPGGGKITIEVTAVRDRNEFLLRVSDSGMGMDCETLGRIFEPFFTTKGKGRGTGLGLSTVSMIVQQYGGRIDVTSTPGAGSTFEITLPAGSA